MAKGLRNELKNVMTLYYLLKLDKKIPTDKRRALRKQGRKVHKVMKRAYKIPYYRQRFDQVGLTPADFRCGDDLVKFPILTRADLREWMQDEISSHPEKLDKLELYKTSGSSGVPLRFVKSLREAACVNANWIRVTMFAGYKPVTHKMVSFLTTHIEYDPDKGDSFIQKFGILRRKVVPEHLYVGEKMRDLINLVNDYQPEMICLRKNVLVRMVNYAEKHGMTIHRPLVYAPISETVDEITRELLERGLGPGLMDAYGCNELGSCAVRLPGEDAFYIYSDTHVLNVVDEHGNLAEKGSIIGTTLYKFDYPIINYEVGDFATCEMRDGMRYLTSILGRSNDMVKHADGVQTSATELMKIPNGTTGIAQFRYVQESFDRLRVLLVRDTDPNAPTNDEIEAHFVREIDDLFGGHEFDVEFDWLDEIPPDANNKMRCFICNV